MSLLAGSMAFHVVPGLFDMSPSATRIELAEVMAHRVDPEPLDTSPSATNLIGRGQQRFALTPVLFAEVAPTLNASN